MRAKNSITINGVRLLSAIEVMRIFGISRATLFRWDRDGYLRKRKIGPRNVYYYESDVLELLEGKPYEQEQ